MPSLTTRPATRGTSVLGHDVGVTECSANTGGAEAARYDDLQQSARRQLRRRVCYQAVEQCVSSVAALVQRGLARMAA